MILKGVTRQEEQFLTARFGAEYTTYAAQVGCYIPRHFGWPSGSPATINRDVVLRTFVKSSLFLAGLPVAALAQWGQSEGVLQISLNLP